MPATAQAPPLKGAALRDFSGGPNISDAASELAANEELDAWNVTYDERGGASSRLGYAKDNGTPFSGGAVRNRYWSPLLGDRVTQAGSSLYLGSTNTATRPTGCSRARTVSPGRRLRTRTRQKARVSPPGRARCSSATTPAR
jgi:hypothetical protein